MRFVTVNKPFKISKITGWDKLFIKIDKKEIFKIVDEYTGRSDGVLFSNIIKNDKVIHGYANWDWKDKKCLCNSHKLSKNGGINTDTVKHTLKRFKSSDLTVILSKGYDNVLETDPKLVESLTKNYTVYNLNSKDAIKQFNKEVTNKNPVIMFLHSTC